MKNKTKKQQKTIYTKLTLITMAVTIVILLTWSIIAVIKPGYSGDSHPKACTNSQSIESTLCIKRGGQLDANYHQIQTVKATIGISFAVILFTLMLAMLHNTSSIKATKNNFIGIFAAITIIISLVTGTIIISNARTRSLTGWPAECSKLDSVAKASACQQQWHTNELHRAKLQEVQGLICILTALSLGAIYSLDTKRG